MPLIFQRVFLYCAVSSIVVLTQLVETVTCYEQKDQPQMSELSISRDLFWDDYDVIIPEDYDWTLYDLQKLDVSLIIECSELIEYQQIAHAWKELFKDPARFVSGSRADLRNTNDTLAELMHARSEYIKSVKAVEQLPDSSNEPHEKDIFEIIYGTSKSEMAQQDEDPALSRTVLAVTSVDEKRHHIQRKLIELFPILDEKVEQIKEILIYEGPLGGGQTEQVLYKDIVLIINYLYDKFDELNSFHSKRMQELQDMIQTRSKQLEDQEITLC